MFLDSSGMPPALGQFGQQGIGVSETFEATGSVCVQYITPCGGYRGMNVTVIVY